MDILFKNATVITLQEEIGILDNACVGVSQEKIEYLGKYDETCKADRVIDCSGKVIMPGLYNCHTHTPMSLLRGYENNRSLHDWLKNAIFPAEDYFRNVSKSTYIGALISIADMIESGTIAFSDMYFKMVDIAKAVDESGIKACLCNPILCNSDEAFDLKTDLSYLETKEVYEQYGYNNSRIKVDMGIHAEYTSNPEAWEQVIACAKDNKLNMQIHLSETKYEHENCKRKYGLTPTQLFDKFHLFDLKTTAAHGVWLEDSDIEILKDKPVTLVNNPVSNLKLASGIASVRDWLFEGINVTLGTDGMASNNSNDLFEEMKFSSLLQKNKYKDTTILPACDVIKMATINGALAQGREKESGKIQIGYDADLILLDFNSTRQTACYDYLSNIVFSCTGGDVVLTMCKGKILYENGEHKTIDVEKLIYEAKKMIAEFQNIF